MWVYHIWHRSLKRPNYTCYVRLLGKDLRKAGWSLDPVGIWEVIWKESLMSESRKPASQKRVRNNYLDSGSMGCCLAWNFCLGVNDFSKPNNSLAGLLGWSIDQGFLLGYYYLGVWDDSNTTWIKILIDRVWAVWVSDGMEKKHKNKKPEGNCQKTSKHISCCCLGWFCLGV